jgi:hypothetical protein
MNDALLIPLLLVFTAISVVVIAKTGRDIWREMKDAKGDVEDETRRERRTEERKNARIRKEIERWREGL